MPPLPLVVELSQRQLDAYNRSDIDAFCACYHDDVLVLAHDGTVVHRGIEAFRRAYGAMFEAHEGVHADVESRLVVAEHVVELEHWRRVRKDTGEKLGGTLLVRYTERDGKIAIAEFLRPRAS